MGIDDLLDMIDKAADAALRSIRPGDPAFTAFTVFRHQLHTLKVEDEHHVAASKEEGTTPSSTSPRDGSGT